MRVRMLTQPKYMVCGANVLLAGVRNGSLLMCGKAGVIQATPNKCWKTLSPALTTHSSEKRLVSNFMVLWFY